MHGTHDPARIICADGDEAEVKGSAQFADLFKGRAGGEVIFGRVVVGYAFEVGDGSVAGVSV